MRVEKVILGENGVLAIPPAVCEEIGLKPGQAVVIESDGCSVLLRTLDQVLREVQESFAPCRVPGVSAADGLIAERRAEAAAESEPWGCAWTQPIE